MKRDLCVFVVDDVPTIAYTLSAILRDWGYRVIPYTDPMSALCDAALFLPDALISDIDMPALGGVDLAIQMRSICPDCTVFLMSGHIGPIDRLLRAQEKGHRFPLFAKPVSAHVLAQQLDALSMKMSADLLRRLQVLSLEEGRAH